METSEKIIFLQLFPDRVLHHCTVINIKGESYRLKERKEFMRQPRQLLPVTCRLVEHDNELGVGQHGAGLHGIQQILHVLRDGGGIGVALAELPPRGIEKGCAELVLKHHMELVDKDVAEIDENFVRTNLSHRELGDLLLHRKELYEAIHPETRQGMRNGQTAKNENFALLGAKSSAQDSADRLGMGKRTVEQLVQTARDLTPAAKKVLRDADDKITKKDALKISRLPPDQQEEAAMRLTTSPPPPKKQTAMNTGTVLSEFKAVCCRYISDIKSFYAQTDIIAEMTFLQYDELGASAYAVTNAIWDFFQEMNAIRNPEEENEYEN